MGRDRKLVSLADGVRLALATVGVLGTASLLFLVTFRERPPEASAAIRPSEEDLLDVATPGRGQLWAVGHHGRILRTKDGGGRWSFPASGVDTPLAGVAARDATIGLAVGYGGVILRTTDGAETWKPVASGVDVYLTSVRFLPEGRALAAGEWGTVLESTDDGATWRTVTAAEHDFIINDFDVAPNGHGWLVGEFGRAMETRDAGRTWTPRTLLPDEVTLFTVDVVSDWEVWIGGADSTLLHSTDGGATWSRSVAPCRPTQILRVRFAEARGYAVGRRCVGVTEDGGRSWRASSLGEQVAYSWLYGLAVGADGVWAAGHGERIFHGEGGDDGWKRVTVARGETPPGD